MKQFLIYVSDIVIYKTEEDMTRVADAVRFLAMENLMMRTGLHHRLLNLSQVARFLHPLVEARLKREVTSSSILMALSRLQRELGEEDTAGEHLFVVDRIHVQSALSTITVHKTKETHLAMQRVINSVQRKGGYLTYTESSGEITVIVDTSYLNLVEKAGIVAPKRLQKRVSAIGVSFRESYAEQPGFLYRLLQQIALQRINVIEVHSTMTEFTIYLREEDMKLAFDSIYSSFVRRS